MSLGKWCLAALGLGLGAAGTARGGIEIAPYVSIKSTKSISPDKKHSGSEDSSEVERKEGGLRFGLSFFSLFKLQLSAGQSRTTTTTTVQKAVDAYGDINYQQDLNMDTSDQNASVTQIETQRNGRLNIVLNPSFSIFILKAQAGVTAMQRLITVEQTGDPTKTTTLGPTYKPNSGFGFGIKLSPLTYCMAEYNMYHYAFPKLEPFEREVLVTYAVGLGN
jgi:hypothetical protein